MHSAHLLCSDSAQVLLGQQCGRYLAICLHATQMIDVVLQEYTACNGRRCVPEWGPD